MDLWLEVEKLGQNDNSEIKMSQTNNNTEIKEQDTQDEIIWEGKKGYTFVFALLDNIYCIFMFFSLFIS